MTDDGTQGMTDNEINIFFLRFRTKENGTREANPGKSIIKTLESEDAIRLNS